MKNQPSDGQEPSDGNSSEGVVIPEEFQQQVHGMLKSATTKHHLNHIRDRVYAKEDEMRKADEAKKSKGGKGKNIPEMMSTDGMPASS